MPFSGLKQAVDAGKRCLGTLELLLTPVASCACHTPNQLGPQRCSIHEYPRFGNDKCEEVRIGLGVFEPGYVDPTTDGGGELLAQIDDALQACVAQVD